MEIRDMQLDDFLGLIASVREGHYEKFSGVINRLFVGTAEQTGHLAQYLWGVYGPAVAQDEEPEDASSED